MLTSTEAGTVAAPDDLPLDLGWSPAVVPGTVAAAVGPDDPDAHADYDARDWWYARTLGPPAPVAEGERLRLRFDGLATLADVWLDSEPLLSSTSMFRAWEVDVTDLAADGGSLVIRFRGLAQALRERRARPRWKTKLVDDQQLRWLRTTLLGRIPAWTPRIAPVGPWRSVWLERVSGVDVSEADVRTGVRGTDGVVTVSAVVEPLSPDVTVDSARVRVGDHVLPLGVEREGAAFTVRGEARVPSPALWWPRTHGEPALHPCTIELDTSAGGVTIDVGRIGFRDVRVDRTDGGVRFFVNGARVFCRGACWTPPDVVTLGADAHQTRRTLELLADANGNMVRVGGTMVYEHDAFYRACDELGIMVWQDFMFANMDYPVDDADFAASCATEAEQQLRRLAPHPCVVAWCGGSEVEQQAAMFGAPREIWSNRYFATTLPGLVARHAGDAPYWTSTPTGGALPFHVGEGLAHYYGVGAYLRPLEDVRIAGVRFTPECLGFSNVPEPSNLRGLDPSGAVPPGHPRWKLGVPRDAGAAWDFEDVRDHYLEILYDVDARMLRSADPDRYVALSRVVTGQVMDRVFSEWRNDTERCGGALVWFLRDLRPGAGWGVVDSDGVPKAAYYYLRRAWAPRCVRLLDRGLDGLLLVVHNDTAEPLTARVELSALSGRGATPLGALDVDVAPRGVDRVLVEDVVGRFLDATYSYRFGPPRHEGVVARLLDGAGRTLSQDVFRTPAPPSDRRVDLDVALERNGSGPEVALASADGAYAVRIDVDGALPVDNYVDVVPDAPVSVPLRTASDDATPLRGFVEALDLRDAVAVRER